ncbi:UDP-N-acetylmuramoyl-tripeptide--D-alanyl-D-alanine ligase [Methylothermus subterraneus]
MRLSELAPVLNGRLLGEDAEFAGVGIDSRQDLRGQLFVALRGTRFDGHDFIAKAQAAGATAALVERPVAGLPQLQVADTRAGLGRLANYWRRMAFAGELVGVTGSNGKTTVKEMIAEVLGGLKTEGNLNNAIGVPLTLLRLRSEHRFAVIEMGANHPGEIDYVARLAEPRIGVITNAGPAHLEGFGSLEGVARAKGELIAALPADGIAVLPADDRFSGYWQELARGRTVLTFGWSEKASVRAEEIAPLKFIEGKFRLRFSVRALGERFEVELGLAGRHNVTNALAAIAVGVALGKTGAEIGAALSRLRPVAGRLRPVPAKGGAWLLDDCYNANPASFEAGLEALKALGGEPWVILGAFAELGSESATFHAHVGRLAREFGVCRLFAVGEESKAAVAAFGVGGQWFASQAELIEAAARRLHPQARVLIKGSRAQQLEKTVLALRQE